MQRRGTAHSLKLQHYIKHTIRLFRVTYRTLVEGVLSLCREAVDVFYSPSQLGKAWEEDWKIWKFEEKLKPSRIEQKILCFHRNKWHMHHIESILQNEILTFLLDFGTQTHRWVSAEWLDINKFTKEKKSSSGKFCSSSRPMPKKEKKKKKKKEPEKKYLDLSEELKKLRNIKITVIPKIYCTLWTLCLETGKETDGIEN